MRPHLGHHTAMKGQTMPTEAQVDAEVAQATASGSSQGQVGDQMLQALMQSQSDMLRKFDQVVSSLTENMTKVSSLSEDISKVQDVKTEETMSGAQAALSAVQANVANAMMTRSQTHFDNLQSIVTIYLAGNALAQNVCNAAQASCFQQQHAANAHIIGGK